MIDRRWTLSILDVRYFKGDDCDTDHYLVATNIRENLAVSKQASESLIWKYLISGS